MSKTPTLDERIEEVLEAYRKNNKRRYTGYAEGGVHLSEKQAKAALKQAVYTALVEQWPAKEHLYPNTDNVPWIDQWNNIRKGHNKVNDNCRAVLSAVLGEKDKENQ